jgi:hypothetical protein
MSPAPPPPLRTVVNRFTRDDGRSVTAILRFWSYAAARGCRLCPLGTCTARHAGTEDLWRCLVVVERELSEAACATFDQHGAWWELRQGTLFDVE